MAYVTFKNRSSDNYKFTVTDLNDPMIAELKEVLIKENNMIKSYRKRFPNNANVMKRNTRTLRIRPRGPRNNSWAYDTPMENAVRYDVYVREIKRY